MSSETITASVGMYDNGTRNCFNQAPDVAKVVRLLNLIPASQGGTGGDLLPASPAAILLYRAILHFQEVQNQLEGGPLSVDGHVDPGAATLGRLSRLAGTLASETLFRREPLYVSQTRPNDCWAACLEMWFQAELGV
jgi:hypothetical protein